MAVGELLHHSMKKIWQYVKRLSLVLLQSTRKCGCLFLLQVLEKYGSRGAFTSQHEEDMAVREET